MIRDKTKRMFSERSHVPVEHDALQHALEARRGRGEAVLDLTFPTPPRGAPTVHTHGDGLARALFLFCDPGDEVLVPEPSGASFAHAAQLAGITLSPYPLRFDGRWTLDTGALWDAITERTRAILALSPNDATGALLSHDELDALGALELPLIVDARLHPRSSAESAVPSEPPALQLWLDAAPEGERLHVTGPRADEAIARLEAMDAVFGPTPAPAERHLAARASLEALREALRDSPLEVVASDPSLAAPVRLPAGESEERWALDLLAHGVLVTPGSRLGFPDDEAWLVLGLHVEPGTMREAARALLDLQLARRAR